MGTPCHRHSCGVRAPGHEAGGAVKAALVMTDRIIERSGQCPRFVFCGTVTPSLLASLDGIPEHAVVLQCQGCVRQQLRHHFWTISHTEDIHQLYTPLYLPCGAVYLMPRLTTR